MSAATTTAAVRAAARRTGARRERRHLHAIDDRPRRHPMVFIALYVVLAIGAVMGAVSLNALAAQDAVELSQLEADVVDAERTWSQSVADVAGLEDPARIRMLAEQMGMESTPQRYLVPEQTLPGDHEEPGTADPMKSILSADR